MPLQLKTKIFYNEIHDHNKGGKVMYIENSDGGFFRTIREMWNRITELIGTNNAPDCVQNNLYDEEYITLKNTNFVKSNCCKDELIIVLHSAVKSNLKTSLIELINYDA